MNAIVANWIDKLHKMLTVQIMKNKGVVISKIFTPAHTDMILIFNPATKTSLPNFFPKPDTWSVKVEVDGKQGSVLVSKILFDSLLENNPIMVMYTIGFFSDNLNIEELSLI